MADFCKQCSIELFGVDSGDLKGLGHPITPLAFGEGYPALCEGCGATLVNVEGECVNPDCMKEHGKQPKTGFHIEDLQ